MIIRLILLFCGLILCCYAQVTSLQCNSKTTCGECIAYSSRCAWCKQDGFDDQNKPRCDYEENLRARNCLINNIFNPNSTSEQKKNRPLSRPKAKVEDIVQIAPQEVHINLRPNTPFDLNIHYRQAEDYPVDLYYLMDLSKSMEDDKEKLAGLGVQLAADMERITSNFRLGFGSFVDKVVMPYVSTVPNKLKAPCDGCAAPYGFINHMPLDTNATRFKRLVDKADVSGNLDAPEGGFDAIMQAVVCKREIKWREQSRKLLIFSTDSGFHYAGDGKLGGIVKPNDGICHLDNKGLYTQSSFQDYPSVSQINQKVIEKKVNIIFAVTAGQVPIYEELSKHIEGSTADKLEDDSSNVVQLVKDQYNQITSGVQLNANETNNIKVNFFSKCLGNKVEKTNQCKELKVGDSVDFTAQIEVKSCPKDQKDWQQILHIYPVGLNEGVIVRINMICECDCERPEFEEQFSSKCSGEGTYECGVCSCNPNFFGRNCQCDIKKASASVDDKGLECRQGNATIQCNGRGNCVCGRCECFPRADPSEEIYGPFCECDNFSCDRADGKICGGNGECKCNDCVCKEGWSGKACDCRLGTETCRSPLNGEICSGNGECVCGICQCVENTEGRFSGQFCEECPTCAGKCDIFRPCVQCKTFQTGEYKEEMCETNCTFFSLQEVDEAKVETSLERLCIFKDEDDCKFTFVYGYDDKNHPLVRVQRTKDCPPPVNLLMIILMVIAGIVLIGLALLLIWKLLTTIHDRREFAKFEKERLNAKWDTGGNPIYKQATSTYKNPTFGSKH